MNPLAVMLSLALLASANASVNTEVGNDYVCSGQYDDCGTSSRPLSYCFYVSYLLHFLTIPLPSPSSPFSHMQIADRPELARAI
jgi:hypothetical protein